MICGTRAVAVPTTGRKTLTGRSCRILPSHKQRENALRNCSLSIVRFLYPSQRHPPSIFICLPRAETTEHGLHTMARLNTTRTQAKEEPRRRTGLKDNSAQPESLGQARPLQDRSSKGSTHKKHSSGTFFDIFPDSVQTHEDENDDVQYKSSPSLPSRKQKTKRTLKAAPVNSLLLPLQHRRRQRPNTKAGTDDYDKENDLTEDTMDSYSVEASPQPSPRRNAEQTPERSRLQDRPMSRLSLESRGSDEEDCGNDTFNSIDDFVVSDNDEISYHETSGSETDEPESPPPPPPKSARKRLLRGRRPGTTNIGAEDNAKKDSSPLRSPCVDDRSSVEDKITPSSSNSPGHMSQDDGQLVTKLTELALEEDLQDVDDKGYTSPQPEETRSPYEQHLVS